MLLHLIVAALSASAALPALSTLPAEMAQPAQNAALPDGFEVLERCVEAIGGEEAYKKYDTCLTKGTIESSYPKDKGSIEIKQKAPHFSLITMEFEQNGTLIQGTTSDMAWMIQPALGTTRFDGRNAQPLIDEAGFYNPVEPREVYKSAETVGIEEHDGVQCYKVLLVTKSGQYQSGLFEVESGLHRQKASYASGAHEIVTNTTEYSDYREANGLKRPFKMVVSMMGMSQTATFDSIEFGVDFDEDTFEPPAE